MAIIYTWEFNIFEKAPSLDGLADVVKVIHWRMYAEDAPYKTSIYGSAPLGAPNPDNFVAYEDITKQWAMDAVSAVIDVPAIQASLAAEIDRQKNPPVVPAPPPFTN